MIIRVDMNQFLREEVDAVTWFLSRPVPVVVGVHRLWVTREGWFGPVSGLLEIEVTPDGEVWCGGRFCPSCRAGVGEYCLPDCPEIGGD